MANKILIVAKREYLERVRSRTFLIFTLVIPVFITGITMFPLYIAAKSAASNDVRHIAILDATGAGLGDRVAKSLMNDSSVARITGDTVAPRVVTVARNPRCESSAAT